MHGFSFCTDHQITDPQGEKFDRFEAYARSTHVSTRSFAWWVATAFYDRHTGDTHRTLITAEDMNRGFAADVRWYLRCNPEGLSVDYLLRANWADGLRQAMMRALNSYDKITSK